MLFPTSDMIADLRVVPAYHTRRPQRIKLGNYAAKLLCLQKPKSTRILITVSTLFPRWRRTQIVQTCAAVGCVDEDNCSGKYSNSKRKDSRVQNYSAPKFMRCTGRSTQHPLCWHWKQICSEQIMPKALRHRRLSEVVPHFFCILPVSNCSQFSCGLSHG